MRVLDNIRKEEVLEENLFKSLLELIRVTSCQLSDDVVRSLFFYGQREKSDSSAMWAMNVIKENIEMAKNKSAPICQDTGTLLVYVDHPIAMSTAAFTTVMQKAVMSATELGYLRQNSVDSLTGANAGLNIGPGHPSLHFDSVETMDVDVHLIMKGGGCENVGAQYSLPFSPLNAGRDLNGVKKVILDAVKEAQGKGCGPGVVGVCVGGDRGSGYLESKRQFLRKLDDVNTNDELARLEREIVEMGNRLQIGPMGLGGETTLFGCKIGHLNRLPASYFVSVSYMCWAFRRQGIRLRTDNTIDRWHY